MKANLPSSLIWLAMCLGLFGAGTSGCSTARIKSDRVLTPEQRVWLGRQRIPLSVCVVISEDPDVDQGWKLYCATNQFENLSRADLFEKETMDTSEKGVDLFVEVRQASGCIGCGNPQMYTKVTLGIIRSTVHYSYSYDFDIRSRKTGKALSFSTRYEGQYRTGFWPAKDDGFVDLLKFDLAQRESEIVALAATED